MTLTVYRADGSPKAARVQVVGDAPVGSLMAYAGSAIPTDWLVCDGSAVARLAYPDLFNAIGTTWGVGNGTTTFNLPDLRNRMLYGAGTRALGVRSQTDPAQANPGEETHKLLAAEIAAHGHSLTSTTFVSRAYSARTDLAETAGYVSGSNGWTGLGAATPPTGWVINANSGDGVHNNMPPYAIVNWIIRVFPPYKTANLVVPTGVPRVTSLPGSPVDNQEVYYVADAANGVQWHLRYNVGSASPYKWEFVGGGWLRHYIQTGESRPFGGTMGDLATVGPQVTIPLAGDYDCDWGFGYGYHSTTIGSLINMALDGCGATSTARVSDAASAAVDVANQGVQAGRMRMTLLALTAGTLKAQYSVGGGSGVGWFVRRYLLAQPVRVG